MADNGPVYSPEQLSLFEKQIALAFPDGAKEALSGGKQNPFAALDLQHQPYRVVMSQVDTAAEFVRRLEQHLNSPGIFCDETRTGWTLPMPETRANEVFCLMLRRSGKDWRVMIGRADTNYRESENLTPSAPVFTPWLEASLYERGVTLTWIGVLVEALFAKARHLRSRAVANLPQAKLIPGRLVLIPQP